MRKVLLTIKGTQVEDGESIEFTTEGRMSKSDSGYLIEYDESDLTGIDGATATVLLDKESVTLSRKGTTDTQLVFSKNSVYESRVSTPLGVTHLSVLALQVNSKLCDSFGSVELEYELSTSESRTVNRLNLSFKSIGEWIN